MERLKLGEHHICDFSHCDRKLLLDSEHSHALFSQAVRASGLAVVDEGLYKFSPYGFTSFLLLAESHASLHAWPEYGYCAVDIFTCNLNLDVRPLIEELRRVFGAKNVEVHKVEREANNILMPEPYLVKGWTV